MGDPNPLVNGTGAKTLTDAGISCEFVEGEEHQACFDINKEFLESIGAA